MNHLPHFLNFSLAAATSGCTILASTFTLSANAQTPAKLISLSKQWNSYNLQCRDSGVNCWAKDQVESQIRTNFPNAVIALCDSGTEWFENGRDAMASQCQLP